MEEIKSYNTRLSFIDDDIINGVENDVLIKDKIKNITLNKFSQKKPSIININAKYDPQVYTTDFIIKRYTTNDYISFIESNYNLNLYKLFQSNTMDSFFQLFYNFTKQFYKLEAEKYNVQINLKISAI